MNKSIDAEIAIERLLFEQVEKPRKHLMTRIINVYDNRYRINVYHEIDEVGLHWPKKRIHSSFFASYKDGELKILYPKPSKELTNAEPTL